MLKKGTKLNSILTGTCPRCQNESMYLEKNPYKVSAIFKMHERCGSCGLIYKIEPSFFFGAMYVSYALGVAVATAFFILSYLIAGFNLLETFLVIIVGLFLILPLLMRYSRNIWINFFVDYKASDSQ
ncbi:MAG: DUF983 domain-containing protein [Bacteroidetes bacterium]|nr:DUF983 domain-containing protein [Bacteroidota bacterium]